MLEAILARRTVFSEAAPLRPAGRRCSGDGRSANRCQPFAADRAGSLPRTGTRIARFARRAHRLLRSRRRPDMDALTLARWQFGITTVYHFFFVPLTLGLAWVVAGLQTAWYVTGDEVWKRLTKFWGKLFLINFAMGVVTGIVQEFQFGMNWSEYSRFVGDVFGAPLAIEALARLLPRVDLPRPVDLRLGQAAEEGAPRARSGSWPSARTSRPCGSSSRTPSCSSRWATRCATAARRWRASGRSSRTPTCSCSSRT